MTVEEINNDNFKKVIAQGNLPLVLDFYATWCGPCQIMHSVIAELANEMKDKVRFAKIDVDQCTEIATQYNILSIPTFILMVNGKTKATRTGASSKGDFQNWLNNNITG